MQIAHISMKYNTIIQLNWHDIPEIELLYNSKLTTSFEIKHIQQYNGFLVGPFGATKAPTKSGKYYRILLVCSTVSLYLWRKMPCLLYIAIAPGTITGIFWTWNLAKKIRRFSLNRPIFWCQFLWNPHFSAKELNWPSKDQTMLDKSSNLLG